MFLPRSPTNLTYSALRYLYHHIDHGLHLRLRMLLPSPSPSFPCFRTDSSFSLVGAAVLFAPISHSDSVNLFAQTGGVTVTLSLAYLAALAHRRHRERQSDVLRAQSHVLAGLARDPSSAQPASVPAPPPLTRAELAAQRRAGFVDTVKDRWNAEVQGAVRWAHTKDWVAVRESAEDSVARVLGVDLAGRVQSAAEATKQAAGTAAGSVGAAVKSGAESARGAVATGVEKAKAAVVEGAAEIKTAAAAARDAAPVAAAAKQGGSDVKKALQQRYEKSDAMKKSASEVLSERYTPIDARDNSRLRGL